MGVEVSKARRKRWGQARRREEERWRRLNGPVVVTRIEPDPEPDEEEWLAATGEPFEIPYEGELPF